MLKYFPIIVFLFLIEYQAFFMSPGEVSYLSATGFIALSLYEVWNSRKGYQLKAEKVTKKTKTKLEDIMAEHKTTAIIIGSLYVFLIALSIFVLHDFGNRIVAILFITATALIGLSTYELLHKASKKAQNDDSTSFDKPNKIRDFTIPVIFLYTLSYLLSIHVGGTFAYQFILLLAVLVLHDIIRRGWKLTRLYELNKISDHDFKHYLFHRWSKYLNFFLTVWYFVVLHHIGAITETQQYVLMYAFLVIFITFVNRMASKFSAKKLAITIVTAGIITFIDPLLNMIAGINLPHYLVAIILLIFFDIADQYFHALEYSEVPFKIWEQKAVVYLLATIFIVQLNTIDQNPEWNINAFFASVFSGDRATEASAIHAEDVQNR